MSPELTMRAILEESAKDTIEHVTSLEGEALDAELRARGVEPEQAERRAEAALAAALAAVEEREEGEEGADASASAGAIPVAAASSSNVVPMRRPVAKAARPAARRWFVMGPLAAAAAFAAVVGAMNAGAIATALRGGPEAIGPDPNVLPPPPPPTAPAPPPPVNAAVALRHDALAACAKKDWTTCVVKLNRAQDIDPQGEELPEVIAARRQLAKVIVK
jgi:hypothetical protein